MDRRAFIAGADSRRGYEALACGGESGIAAALTGCADRLVTLRYTPPPARASLAPGLVILPFMDGGKEGDQVDMRRVGGIYGGYGNRVAKVMLTEPWPPRFMQALVAEFRATGVGRLLSGLVGSSAVVPPA